MFSRIAYLHGRTQRKFNNLSKNSILHKGLYFRLLENNSNLANLTIGNTVRSYYKKGQHDSCFRLFFVPGKLVLSSKWR